jgi:hypothetical protein
VARRAIVTAPMANASSSLSMTLRRSLRGPILYGLAVLALLWPAFSNRFPIVFYDTGGYLGRPFEGTLLLGRSAFYGAFLAAGVPTRFWLDIVVQAAVVVWIIALALRTHDGPWFGARDAATRTFAVVLAFSVLTGLPWFAAQLMPDIFEPLVVIALYLLAFRNSRLRRAERIGLIVLIGFGIASHMAILAIACGLVVVLCALRLALRVRGGTCVADMRMKRPALGASFAALLCGLVFALGSNLLIAGAFGFTPGGTSFIFARILQDGIVARYLKDTCPDPTLRLCAYKDQLPQTTDDWLWDDPSPLNKLGGAKAFEPEARRILLDTLRLYPALYLTTALTATAEQFIRLKTGDGLTSYNFHVEYMLKEHAPGTVPAYYASVQYSTDFDFAWLNVVQYPIALLSILGLIAQAARSWQIGARRDTTRAMFFLIALAGNAFICGALSNPHDRYQNRLVWIAPLSLLLARIPQKTCSRI